MMVAGWGTLLSLESKAGFEVISRIELWPATEGFGQGLRSSSLEHWDRHFALARRVWAWRSAFGVLDCDSVEWYYRAFRAFHDFQSSGTML